MAYVGNQAQTAFTSFDKQTITGDGTAVYTLSHSVANDQEVEVFVNNVRQEGGSGKAYTVSGNQITFSENIASTDTVYLNFAGKAVQTVVPPAGSVTDSMITGLSSSKLTGALPALDGSSLTGISSSPILQVVYGELTSKVTVSSGSFVDIGLSASITPSSTSSDLLIIPSISAGINNNGSVASFDLTDSSNNSIVNHTDSLGSRIKGIGQITAGVNAVGFISMSNFGMPIKISPNTTSQVTYKVRAKRDGATLQINATGNDTDNATYVRTISTLTIMELGS